MYLPVIVLGGGGHCRVLLDTLGLLGKKVLGVCEKDVVGIGSIVNGVPVIGTDDEVLRFHRHDVELVNGIGSVGSTGVRAALFKHFRSLGYRFSTVIHPTAIIASDVVVEEGAQIMAGAVIQTGCRIGFNSIINTRASIDHDCVIGADAHLAPGVVLSGNVNVCRGVHIGTGAIVIQGINICQNSIVGAGSAVLRDVAEGVTVFGVPARQISSP
jgi:sugar O-acyltransferase (sialic acid O-acetyltransferase NeuD family)